MKLVAMIMILIALPAMSLLSSGQVFAQSVNAPSLSNDEINFSVCADAKNHHCMIPFQSETITNNNGQDEAVVIHLPQNGAPVIEGVLSKDNYTALENNVAVMMVQFTPTTLSPTLNYCPQAKIILENQGVPSYLNKFYVWNATTQLNLTHFIYPDYCNIETGANPIDGTDHIVPVPEFPNIVQIIGFIALFTAISIISLSKRLKLK